MLCPCCSGKTFEQCCQPLIEGNNKADTPEALMRSRYCAYTQKAVDYIIETYAQSKRVSQSKQDILNWANSAEFVHLKIIDTFDQNSNQKTLELEQFVEFKADYIEQGKWCVLHEKSRFVKEQGAWRYIDGTLNSTPAKTIGRNDPCPCQSSKKFKKCHGK